MLKTSMEFKKGILFIRLKGDLNKETVEGIINDDFKYIVLNIDNMYSIDSYSINYLSKWYHHFEEERGKLVICDKYNSAKRLIKEIPKISSEYDAFGVFERMI